ncbi:UNVERIFIED_CONTAM: cytochrome c-type biogenesis protein [Acetivibrio alkalicellulosi]
MFEIKILWYIKLILIDKRRGIDIKLYIFSFLEGIVTFISPCVIPILPVYFSYLAGSDKGDKKKRLLINSLGFVLGFTLVFTALGVAATSIGGFINNNSDILRKVSSGLIIVLGLYYIGIFKVGFLNRERRFEYKFENLKFIHSVIFGFVFGFGWTPCIGPILGAVLVKAANSNSMTEGISLLLVYSMGVGLPFIMSAMVFDSIKGVFTFIKKNNRVIRIISGILLVLSGMAMLFNFI